MSSLPKPAVLLAPMLACVALAAVRAQAPAPAGQSEPAFEAATVKPNKSGDFGASIRRQPGGRFTATNMPLTNLIRNAYQVQGFQVEGAPSWVETERYDIVAKAEGDPPPTLPGGPPDPMLLMLRSLLVERFHLRVHREVKELPIYALVKARADGRVGAELRTSSTDCVALMAARGRANAPPPPQAPGERPICGLRVGFGRISSGGFPLSQLAAALAPMVQRVVVDRTGLAGTYDFDMTFTPDQSQLPPGPAPPGAPAIDPNGPSLFTALQEQLGLKLEATRGPVDVLVIDNVERPAPD